MLTELVIENFKAFGERQVIPLAPITLIFGSNSAGKSSIIQSLLLMKQSNLGRDDLVGKDELVIRGELTDLASFRALIHHHDEKLELTLGLSVAGEIYCEEDYATGEETWVVSPPPVGFEMSFGMTENDAGTAKTVERRPLRLSFGGELVTLQPLPFYFTKGSINTRRECSLSEFDTRTLFSWALKQGRRNNRVLGPTELALHPEAVAILAGGGRPMHGLSFERFQDEDAGLIGSDHRARSAAIAGIEARDQATVERLEPVTSRLEGILAGLIAIDPSDRVNQSRLLATARACLTEDDGYSRDEISFLGWDAITDALAAKNAVIKGFEWYVSQSFGFPHHRDDASDFVDELLGGYPNMWIEALEHLQYLGPLRAVPDRFTVLTGGRGSGVGTRGENVVSQLFYRQETLTQANEWLKRLEIPYEIELRGLGDTVSQVVGDVVALLLKDVRTGVSVSTSDVGFGISQILPVVVATLTMTGLSGTLCIEQPELHLHPGLQARLGDLFAQAYLDDADRGMRRQFILETHSEHLLLRMQRLIRRGTLKPEDVCVLHVGFDDGGRSVVKRLEIDSLGDFTTDWPGGFFDERLDEIFGD